jgi:hypothetical protein
MANLCLGGHVEECRIIETLADFGHGHCVVPDHGHAQERLNS